MAVAQNPILEKNGSQYVVRDVKSGRSFKLKGYGALRGQIAFRSDNDLTKPIAEQVTKVKPHSKKATLARPSGAKARVFIGLFRHD